MDRSESLTKLDQHESKIWHINQSKMNRIWLPEEKIFFKHAYPSFKHYKVSQKFWEISFK